MKQDHSSSTPRWFIGIDVGGTFTDFVIFDSRTHHQRTFKILSSFPDPSEAVLKGLAEADADGVRMIIHGSTVATNALLERKGAKTALVTSEGFRDVLTIGRQERARLYDWFYGRPAPLVPSKWCWEVSERIDCHGQIVEPLHHDSLPQLAQELRAEHIESVAISFLFSFAAPAHEREVAAFLRSKGFLVSASHEVIPEFREYERASTTVINAYVSPVLNRYLGTLEKRLAPSPFHILQSNGGRIRVTQARTQGVRSILSGPAGGVVGAFHVAREAGYERILTFDMGGTSTDVSLVDGRIHTTNRSQIGGMPVHIPVIDLHTVGAGGGSLAMRDMGGSLRVGPESAGSYPGPMCYGQGGTVPTVTDANLVLGRLPQEGLLGGQMRLDGKAARYGLHTLAGELGLSPRGDLSPVQVVANGIKDVVNAQMERALRVISVERGYDPREFALVSFGGAGGAHACELAHLMGIRTILIPPCASTLSAFGMLVADVVVDYGRTVMLPGETPFEELEALLAPLVEQARCELHDQGVREGEGRFEREVDVRYRGQSYELSVPFTQDFRKAFDRQHLQLYGFQQEEAAVEIVNLRVRGIGKGIVPPSPAAPLQPADASEGVVGECPLVQGDRLVSVRHYAYHRLSPGNTIMGPAIISQPDTTIYLTPDCHATVDAYGNLIIERQV